MVNLRVGKASTLEMNGAAIREQSVSKDLRQPRCTRHSSCFLQTSAFLRNPPGRIPHSAYGCSDLRSLPCRSSQSSHALQGYTHHGMADDRRALSALEVRQIEPVWVSASSLGDHAFVTPNHRDPKRADRRSRDGSSFSLFFLRSERDPPEKCKYRDDNSLGPRQHAAAPYDQQISGIAPSHYPLRRRGLQRACPFGRGQTVDGTSVSQSNAR
jgi:hypothetical protein